MYFFYRKINMRITRTTFLLMATDLIAANATLALMMLLRLGPWSHELALYPKLFVVLTVLLPLSLTAFNLYAAVAYGPPQELKRTTYGVSLTFLMLTMFLFLTKGSGIYSRLIIAFSWVGCLFTIPLARAFTRWLVHEAAWFGRRFVLVGRREAVLDLLIDMRSNAVRGFKPMAIALPGEPAGPDAHSGLPSFYGPNACSDAARAVPGSYAVLAVAGFSEKSVKVIVDQASRLFSSIVIVPPFLKNGTCLWVSALDLGGGIGLLVRQNLLSVSSMRIKRLCDLCLTIVGGLLVLPFFGLLALLIRLDSPGPVFFRQERIGRNGKPIYLLKFRTMYENSAEMLEQYMKDEPQLAEEWARDHKLRNDPRVTRVGAFLRRTSMDELPQLWNVLKGEMSLVGPRPVVEDEVEKYGDSFELYTRVLPGMSGLWQVSGRNDLSYDQRVALDCYYVCNWSVWMDIWILMITVPALLKRRGAY